MTAPIDLNGGRYGKLVAREPLPRDRRGQGRRWLCECDCGQVSYPRAKDLLTGNSASCGCLRGRKRDAVSALQLEVLAAIGRAGGSRWQAGLEHAIGRAPARVSAIAAALEARGCLKRLRVLHAGRRRTRLVLLHAGWVRLAVAVSARADPIPPAELMLQLVA